MLYKKDEKDDEILYDWIYEEGPVLEDLKDFLLEFSEAYSSRF